MHLLRESNWQKGTNVKHWLRVKILDFLLRVQKFNHFSKIKRKSEATFSFSEEEDSGCGSWNCGRRRKRRIWSENESEKRNEKRMRERKIRRRNPTVVSDDLSQVSPLSEIESAKPSINPSWERGVNSVGILEWIPDKKKNAGA